MDQTDQEPPHVPQNSPLELSFSSKRHLRVYLPQTSHEAQREPLSLETVRKRPVFLPAARGAGNYGCQVNSVTASPFKPFLTPQTKLPAKSPKKQFLERFSRLDPETPRRFELTRITLGTNYTPKFVKTFRMKGMSTRSRNRAAHVFSVASASRQCRQPHV